jgi:hypothetical protein
MRAARAGEESREPGRCGIEAGDPERRPGERIAVLDPPAAGRKGALVPSRQREPWPSRLPDDDRLTHPPARSQRRKACSARVIEGEDRTGGGPPATLKCRAAADPKSIRCWFDPAEVLQFIRQHWAQPGLVIDPVFGALHRQCAHACGLALSGHGIFAERPCPNLDLLVQFPLMLQPARDGSEPIVSGPGRHSHNRHQRLPFPIRVADDDAPVIMPPGSAR